MFLVQNSQMLSCKVVTLFPYRRDVPFNSLDCVLSLWLIIGFVTRINTGSLYSGTVDILLIFHKVLSSIKTREFLVHIGDY